MDALDAGYHGVLVELDAVSTRFADLLSTLDVAGIQKDIESVSKQSRDQMDMLGRLKDKIEDLNAEIDSLRERNKNLEAENTSLKLRVTFVPIQEYEDEEEEEEEEEEGEEEEGEEGEEEEGEEGEEEEGEEEGREGQREKIIHEILDQIAENVFLNEDNPEPRFTSHHNNNGQILNMKNFKKLVRQFVSHRDHEPIIFQPKPKFKLQMKTHPLWDKSGVVKYRHEARKFMEEMPTASWNDKVPVSASPPSSSPSSPGY